MPRFTYTAVDSQGKPVSGTMEQDSARRVATVLQEQGLQVNSIQEGTKWTAIPRMKHSLGWEDVELFNQHLLSIVRARLPLADSIRVVSKDIGRGSLQGVLQDIERRVASGTSLSDAVAANAHAFPAVYVAAIRAGDATGNLPAILVLLERYTRSMLDTKYKTHELSAYPILIFFACIVFLMFMFTRVIPQFEEVFADFGGQMPYLTRAIFDLSQLVRNHSLGLIGGLLAVVMLAIGGMRLASASESAGYALDTMKLRLWGIRRAFMAGSLARFCQTAGILLTGRVPLAEAVELAGATSGNAVLNRATRDCAARIRIGDSFSAALGSTGFFSHTFHWLIGTSEERGDLDRTLLELAESYEQEYGRSSRLLLTLLGPAAVMLVAVVVGAVVLALYLPLFTLSDMISGG